MQNLRHGLVTCLAEQGIEMLVIHRMLRHSDVEMTMKYVHSQAREAQEISSKNSFLNVACAGKECALMGLGKVWIL